LQKGRPSGMGPITDLSLVNNPKKFILKSIIMTPVPLTGFKATGCKPAVELYDRAGFTLPHGMQPLWSFQSPRKYRPADVAISITVDQPICGEVLLKFHHISMESMGGHTSLIFRIHFHTSFLDTTYLDLPLRSLDAPESDLSMLLSPSKILDERFRVRLLLAEIVDNEEKYATGTESLQTEIEAGKIIEEIKEEIDDKKKCVLPECRKREGK